MANQRPMVDAHVHIWDVNQFRYSWLDGNQFLNRNFLLEDYRRASDPMPVAKIVFVQAECHPSQSQAEVDWITQLAAENPVIQGIVAYAPLEQGGGVRGELERLKTNSLVKGIRRIIQGEDPSFCLRPDFVAGVRLLAEFGWSFDICIDYQYNSHVIQLVDRCPDVKFVLDHMGKPDIRGRQLDPWREEIQQLSTFDNVFCKMSSLATEADHQHWTVADLSPFVEHVVECFGYDRIMFGSDWPVSSQAASFAVGVETLERFVLRDSDRDKVFFSNADVFYTL